MCLKTDAGFAIVIDAKMERCEGCIAHYEDDQHSDAHKAMRQL